MRREWSVAGATGRHPRVRGLAVAGTMLLVVALAAGPAVGVSSLDRSTAESGSSVLSGPGANGKAVATALAAQVAPPDAGALDPTFDEDGVATIEVVSDVEVVDSTSQPLGGGREAVLLLVRTPVEEPDGEGPPGQYALWRMLPTGELDLTFDDDGVLPISRFFSADAVVGDYVPQHVATSENGGILLAGTVPLDDQPPGVGFRRLQQDGSVEGGFGTNGDLLAPTTVETAWPPQCPTMAGLDQQDITAEVVVDAAADPAAGDAAVLVALGGQGNRYDVFVASSGSDVECVQQEQAPAAILLRFDEQGIVTGGAAALDGDLQDNPAVDPAGLVVDGQRIVVSAVGATGDGVPGEEQVVAMQFLSVLGEDRDLGLDPEFGDSFQVGEFSGRHGVATHDLDVRDDAGAPLPVVVMGDGSLVVAVDGTDGDAWHVVAWNDVGDPPAGVTDIDLTGVGEGGDVRAVATTADASTAVLLGTIDVDTDESVDGFVTVDSNGEVIRLDVAGHPWQPSSLVSTGLVRLSDGTSRSIGTLVVARTPPASSFGDDGRHAAITMRGLGQSGVLDDEFGPTGAGHATVFGGTTVEGRAVAVAPDRSVLAAGRITDDGSDIGDDGFAARLDESGTPDEDFAAGPPPGTVLVREQPTEAETEHPETLAVDGADIDVEERPVLAGESLGNFFDRGGGLARLGPETAVFDPTFTTGPVAFVDDIALHDVVTGDDAAVSAVGESFSDDEEDGTLVVVRRTADGGPDPLFGPGGSGVLSISQPDGEDMPEGFGGAVFDGRGITIDDAGRLIVTGWVEEFFFEDAVERMLVGRLAQDAAGTWDWDVTFGPGDDGYGPGVVVGPDGHRGHDVAVDGTDIVVVGTRAQSPSTSATEAFVTRLSDDGSVDTSFGSDGFSTPFGPPSEGPRTAGHAVAIDAVGDVVVTGASIPPPIIVGSVPLGLFAAVDFGAAPPVVPDLLVARLLPDGAADDDFGDGGLVATDLGLDGDEAGEDVVIAPDGKIVVAGHVTDDRSTRALVARYLPGVVEFSCTPDPTNFGDVLLPDSTQRTVTCAVAAGRVAVDEVAIDPGSVDADAFSLVSDDCVGTIMSAGDTCQVEVDFVPDAVGGFSADLDLTGRTLAGSLDDDVALLGRGIIEPGTPLFDASPDPLVFAQRRVGTTSPVGVITVTNVGTGPLAVSNLSLVGANAADYAIVATTCPEASLPPSETCTVDIRFTPTLGPPGARPAALRFVHGAAGSPDDVGLRGAVTQPTLDLDPVEGPIGTVVDATGEGFATGVTVRLFLGDLLVATIPPGGVSGGTFTTTFEVPGGTPGGPITVTACQACDGPRELAASQDFLVTPRLFASPAVGPPGSVTQVLGDGFVPDVLAVVQWDRGIGAVEVVPDELGEFQRPFLVFHRDMLGTRLVQAVTDPEAEEPDATAPFLVVPGSSQPGDFAIRR